MVVADFQGQRVLLSNVPWATYVLLSDTVDAPGVHMTYLHGDLEIARTSSRNHEVTKSLIRRMLQVACFDHDIPLYGYGSTTLRDEQKACGLDPDESFCRGADREIPDVAIEVVVSNAAIDKLKVYEGLGVREVWIFENKKTRVLALRSAGYEAIAKSEVFPEVDFATLLQFAGEPDQHAALVAFRETLRG